MRMLGVPMADDGKSCWNGKWRAAKRRIGRRLM